MKLKKIASLALAGVMAVSMLAGCATKEPTKEPTANTTLADYAVEALTDAVKDSDAKVTVSVDLAMQTTLDAAVKVPGMTTANVESYLMGKDSTLKTGALSAGNVNDKSAATEAKIFGVALDSDPTNAMNAKTMVTRIADWVAANKTVEGSNNKLAGMTVKSKTFNDKVAGVTGEAYHYVYNYSVKVAVVSIQNPVTGAVDYAMAYTVTRTPVKTAGAGV